MQARAVSIEWPVTALSKDALLRLETPAPADSPAVIRAGLPVYSPASWTQTLIDERPSVPRERSWELRTLDDGRRRGRRYGPTGNSIASESDVVWFEVLSGSRYQSCA